MRIINSFIQCSSCKTPLEYELSDIHTEIDENEKCESDGRIFKNYFNIPKRFVQCPSCYHIIYI